MAAPPTIPPVPPADELFLIGRIARPHGVGGEVKVFPETDDPARLLALPVVFVGRDAARVVERKVERARLQAKKGGKLGIVKLSGVDDRDAAEALRQHGVFVRASELPPLEEDEFYWHDLIGLAVVTDAGEAVGTVADVRELPGHELLVVRRDGAPDTLIPAVPAFIDAIDLDARRLVITPIEGLL